VRTLLASRTPPGITALFLATTIATSVGGFLLPSARIGLGHIVGVVSLAVARFLRPSRPDSVKLMNYECGAEPIGPAWVQFPAGFYLVALVFIVFDALAVFLFPWALILRAAGLPAFWVMAAFVATLGLGWLYAYREGVLEWK